MEETHASIGIDLGGTKISGIVLLPDGTFAHHQRVPSPQDDYHATITAVRDLVSALDKHSDPIKSRLPVGIGTPGAEVPKTGRIQNANSTWLNGQSLRKDLEAALERPVRIANDANCLVLSEAHDGAARDARTVFGVILGTGVGGALVVNRHLVVGRNAIAGEWGHCALPSPSPEESNTDPCWCGQVGCLETWLSGPAMARDHKKHTGDVKTAEDIAQAHDTACEATLDRHADRLARGLAMVCNVLDPDVFVLGGGLSKMPHLYETVPKLMEKHAFTTQADLLIKPAQHGDDSGVRGAARLWMQ